MTKKHTGHCACGQVTFGFDTMPTFSALCHCLDCKHASGGEGAMWFGVSNDDFQLTSGTPKGFSYVADSGKKLVRNFCPNCGSRMYTSDLEAFPGLTFVQVGVLDDATGFAPQLEMFTKRRLPWAKPLDMPQFTDMPH
ncbi:MAG: GFA family protein [Kofleriaceae bacterium]